MGSELLLDAAEVLRRCQMPEDEIRWVLSANDPTVVHMILELHRERLEEELAERRKALGALEDQMVGCRPSLPGRFLDYRSRLSSSRSQSTNA